MKRIGQDNLDDHAQNACYRLLHYLRDRTSFDAACDAVLSGSSGRGRDVCPKESPVTLLLHTCDAYSRFLQGWAYHFLRGWNASL